MKPILFSRLAIVSLALLVGVSCSGKKGGPMKIPKYVTEEYFVGKYKADIQAITRTLAAGEDLSSAEGASSLHADLLCVIARGKKGQPPPIPFKEFKDLYGKHTVAFGGGHHSRNGSGVIVLVVDGIKETALVKDLSVKDAQYWLCFRDTH